MDESYDGVQAGPQGGVRGRWGGEQQHLGRRVFLGVEVVFIVVAGERVGLDLDPTVGDAGEVADAPVVAVALGEDQPEAVTDEPDQLAGELVERRRLAFRPAVIFLTASGSFAP
ncbi:hypothetical protein [Streptomyces sp. NPDC056160]|uniref:hypothetical protein n=1 Tax=Streptomyces sp. NPDC056160 TaxID=3345731 RepID=UPI0035D74F54